MSNLKVTAAVKQLSHQTAIVASAVVNSGLWSLLIIGLTGPFEQHSAMIMFVAIALMTAVAVTIATGGSSEFEDALTIADAAPPATLR